MVVFFEGGLDAAQGGRPGVDDRARAEALGGHEAGAVAHAAVRDGRAVLDDQDLLALDLVAVLQEEGGIGLDDDGRGVDLFLVGQDGGHAFGRGRVHLVEDDDVGPAEVRLSGVIEHLVARPQRVGHHDLQVGLVEGEVVVAAVPEDDVGFLLGLAQDGLVIHAGVDDDAGHDMGLVLLALLDRAFVAVEVGQLGVALDLLDGQVAVGHGMADGGHAAALGLEDLGHLARGLALAAPGADGADRDHRPGALDHGVLGAEQDERGARGLDLAGLVHDVLVGHVAVGEIDLGHVEFADERVELFLGVDGDAVRIELSGQDGRILAAFDVGNLGGREGHDLEVRVVPEVGVEIVEIPARGAHDDDFFHAYDSFVFTKKHRNCEGKNRGSIHHP